MKMERSTILKWTGIAFGSFIVITVIMFFLYPYLNEEKHDEIASQTESSEEVFNSKEPSNNDGGIRLGKEFEYLNGQIEYYKSEQSRLLAIIDSLQSNNEEMKRDYEQQIAELIEQNVNVESFSDQGIPQQKPVTQQEQPQQSAAQAQLVADAGNVGMEMNQEEQEEFFNKVKSFLNLDEEELAPIVSNMDNEELVRLYKGGGTIQREKLLRSLKPERAAEIMKVIML